MIIGYARCSTSDQNLDWQVDALKQYGCETIFSGVSQFERELLVERTRAGLKAARASTSSQ